MEQAKPTLLGVLGGLGPMATVYFYELLTRHTRASCDQEHIDAVLSSRASTPDRTAFILGRSGADPFDVLLADARRLAAFGADLLVIPCNTAHFFYERLAAAVPVPFLNMVERTVLTARAGGCRTLGLLATEGTVKARVYQDVCDRLGVTLAVPDAEGQAAVMRVIYENVKQGRRADMADFLRAVQSLRAQGAERIVLGCTELSLVRRDEGLDDFYLDSMEVLAHGVLCAFGKTPVGFSFCPSASPSDLLPAGRPGAAI